MPDGDIVHDRLGRFYQKPYKSLCGGKDSTSECVTSVLKALKKDLLKKGDIPVVLAQQIGEMVTPILIKCPEKNSADWVNLNKKVDKFVQQEEIGHYLKELVRRAAKSFLHDFRYGQSKIPEDAPKSILQRYINEVYRSSFKERIPQASENCNNRINDEELYERIEEMQPDLDSVVDIWAENAILNQKFKKLSIPSCQRENEIEALPENEDDLLAGHNHDNGRKITSFLKEKRCESREITTQDFNKYLSSSL